MTNGSKSLGNHVLWVPEGNTWDSPSAGTASRTSRPPANATLSSASIWKDFGAIVELDLINPTSDDAIKTIMAPAPGALQPYDQIAVKRAVAFKFKAFEMQPLLFELLWRIPAANYSNTAYNPNASMVKKGWVQLLQYDHGDALFNTLYHYGSIVVDGDISQKSDDKMEVPLKFVGLYSTLNTGTVV